MSSRSLLRAAPGPFQVLFSALVIIASAAVHAEEPRELLDSSYLPRGERVRRVFREVVDTPKHWAVRILQNGQQVALGTVVGTDGWIISKASQLMKATHVEFSDGRQLPVQMVGYHQGHDLALLKVAAQSLPEVQWEDQAPEVGTWMVTVGTDVDPVSVGVMSAPRRGVPPSGVSGVLGIRLSREDDDPRIQEVVPNSGASKAGLLEGDTVLKVDQRDITSGQQLIRTLRTYRPGDTVSLRIRREDGVLEVRAMLTYPFGEFLSRIAFQNQMGGSLSFRRDDFQAVYQHDSVLSPEECGGPVCNLDGKVVGVNIARAGRTESYILPADLVLSVLPDLKAGKYPPPPSGSEELLPAETVAAPAAETP